MTTGFYRQADGIIITYSITSKQSFESMDDWITGILKYKDDSLPKMILGNKCDLEEDRQVPEEEAEEYFGAKNLKHF